MDKKEAVGPWRRECYAGKAQADWPAGLLKDGSRMQWQAAWEDQRGEKAQGKGRLHVQRETSKG